MALRICIFGAGGVGGWLSARLAEARAAEVVIIARGAHGTAIREHGLRLRVLGKTHMVELPPSALEVYESAEEAQTHGMKPVQFAILGVKTWQVREAALAVEPLLAPGNESCVVTTQNGIDAPTAASEAVGHTRVLGGSCKVNAYVAEPGVIEMAQEAGTFQFGEVYDADGAEIRGHVSSSRVECLAAACGCCKGLTKASGVAPAGAWAGIWEKAISMCCVGPLGALCRAPHSQLLGIPETRRVLKQLMLEVAVCGNTAGHLGTPETAVEVVIDRLDKLVRESAPGVTASTVRDVIRGAPSEIFELSGAICRIGLRLGVLTPTHDLVLAALLPQEYRARGEKPYSLQGIPEGVPHVDSSVKPDKKQRIS